VHRAENLTTSCADCREIWELHLPGTVRACPGIALIFFCAPLYGMSHCGLVYYTALEGSNTSGYKVFYCALEDQDVLEGYNISGYRGFYCALED
jgi:hypothetical protein